MLLYFYFIDHFRKWANNRCLLLLIIITRHISREFSIWFCFMCETVRTKLYGLCTYFILPNTYFLSLHATATADYVLCFICHKNIEWIFLLSRSQFPLNESIWFYVQIEMFYVLCHFIGVHLSAFYVFPSNMYLASCDGNLEWNRRMSKKFKLPHFVLQ